MKKVLILSAAVLVVGLVGGCSSSKSDDCGDYVKKYCAKLQQCGLLDQIGYTESQCVSLSNDDVKANDTTTQECKDSWNEVNKPCAELFN